MRGAAALAFVPPAALKQIVAWLGLPAVEVTSTQGVVILCGTVVTLGCRDEVPHPVAGWCVVDLLCAHVCTGCCLHSTLLAG